jgi:hypothetical protein
MNQSSILLPASSSVSAMVRERGEVKRTSASMPSRARNSDSIPRVSSSISPTASANRSSEISFDYFIDYKLDADFHPMIWPSGKHTALV